MHLALLLLLATPSSHAVEGKNIRIEFNQVMHTRISAKLDRGPVMLGPFTASEFVMVDGRPVQDFSFVAQKQQPIRDSFGSGRQVRISGTAPSLRKTIVVTVYDEFPRMAFFEVEYTNTGTSPLQVNGWTNHHYAISGPEFWSYQSGSYRNRPDWVLQLKAGFQQQNSLGVNSNDYGGGTPVVDVWRRDAGIGVGHLQLSPKLVSLPVAMPDAQQATLEISFRKDEPLQPGATLKTFRTFVTVHNGDYFQTLTEYRRAMMRQGVRFDPAPESAFEPIWCGWGYGKTFTPKHIYGALPIVKKLGFRWVTVDWGWSTTEGDWFLEPQKFPKGDRDMKAMVDRIHDDGMKAQLWWGPLIVNPSSELLKDHPDWVLLNADGGKQRISFWNGWYLCPAQPDVIEHHRRLVVKMLKDWGYEGLKLDGQHMNGAPPCYNPAHKHARPEESVEAMPKFFKMIYDTARSIRPDALIEWCPCGTSFNFYTLPYLNMSVASDPRGSFQVRSKGKTLKGLHGDSTAFFGDHVELSTGRDDFASTVGIGGVVGTNFTWPPGSGPRERQDLTPEKEQVWAKWIRIYKEKMLSRGEYLGGLYDIGFDRPEAHAIRKAADMYYAFYAPEWTGKVELRGLANRRYRVTDYENGKDLGLIRGPVGTLDVQFQKHLLLEAKPE